MRVMRAPKEAAHVVELHLPEQQEVDSGAVLVLRRVSETTGGAGVQDFRLLMPSPKRRLGEEEA